MIRKLFVVFFVLALATPAWAVVQVTNGTNSQDISITLTIPCITKIWWAPQGSGYSWDLNDQAITFNDTVQNGSNCGDWWRNTLTGAYWTATKASTDPWATDYYESYDAALFWLESNCNTKMDLISLGDLTEPNGGTLPTWYTVALTNNSNCNWNVDCGFIDGGTRHSDGIIPVGGGMGCYADDANADYAMELFGGAFYPSQFSFPMVDASGNTTYLGNFTAYAEGTVLFHARALRSGTADAAGNYTTRLRVWFHY